MDHKILKASGSILFEKGPCEPEGGVSNRLPATAKVSALFSSEGRAPRLEIPSEPRARNLAGSVRILLRRGAPRKFISGAHFRDCWVTGRAPRGALAGAAAWHLVCILVLLPLLELISVPLPVAPRAASQELTWYGPASDLPEIRPSVKVPAKPRTRARRAALRREEAIPEPPPAAEAFHPYLTIINRPLRVNHPRQTLIQPSAQAAPPKILPPLPNVVAWDSVHAPEVRMDPVAHAPRRTRKADAEVAPPDIAEPEKVMDLMASRPQVPAPALALNRLAAPRPRAVREAEAAPELEAKHSVTLTDPRLIAPQPDVAAPALALNGLAAPSARAPRASESAPEVGAMRSAALSDQRLIALSAAPAPVAPPTAPLGNLESRLSISPDGGRAAASGSSAAHDSAKGSADRTKDATKSSGPPGLTIIRNASAGAKGLSASVNGNPLMLAPSLTSPRGTAADIPRNDIPTRTSPGELAARLKAGAKPESLLDPNRAHSMQVNMPNLTSATGSWILSFAELDAEPDANEGPRRFGREAALTDPVPVHKVDPQYPPQLRKEHIQGDVVLYAVIRKDGSVDSIQLLEGVDPVLDQSAMRALAQWKFRPAERDGEPVELEAIIHIPLRATAPDYY